MPSNTPETQALLPCPFCDGEAQWKEDPGVCDVPFGLVVEHQPSCFLGLPKSESAALAAWNNRTSSRENDERLREALEAICDPVAALRRYAESKGRKIDGAVAFQLSNDPNHLKSIACEAIAKRPKIGHAKGCVKINCGGCGADFYSTDYSHHARAALTHSALSGDNSQSSSNAGGVEAAWERLKTLCCDRPTSAGGLFMVNKSDFFAALASLSTPTAEPMGEEVLGRFGHHPDPAIDFEHEVEQIESIVTDLEKGMRAGEAVPLDRIERAMTFRVGGDAGAVAAKASLRKLETRALALTTPPTPHEFVKNPLIPFPSCQVCMGPENAEGHSPPTPDRIGKDAVRETVMDQSFANIAPIEWGDCEWQSLAAALADTKGDRPMGDR